MAAKEKYQIFRPRRRAFAARPRPLFSPGTWLMGLAGAAFGGVIAAGWLRAPETPPPPVAAAAEPLPQPAPMETAVLIIEAPAALPATAPVKAALTPDPPAAEEPAISALMGVAGAIIDGDTFYLEGNETRLRLWGVDAPERNAPGGAEATEALTALIAGKALACEEMDRDRYARIVARCLLDDGRDIARVMIEIGAATEMTRFSGGYYGG